MIIVNEVEDQQSPSKRSLALSQSEASTNGDVEAPPPAYEQSGSTLPTPVSAQSTTPLLGGRSRRHSRLRFLKALAVACLIYATFSAVLIPGVIAIVKHLRPERATPSPPTVPTRPAPSQPSKPKKPNNPDRRIECHRFPGKSHSLSNSGAFAYASIGTTQPGISLPILDLPLPDMPDMPMMFDNQSSASFSFPIDLPVLFLRSSGRQASGVVTFVEDMKGDRNVIDIIIHHGSKPQDLLEICTVKDYADPELRQGLTIEVLDGAGWDEHIASLDITVSLAASKEGRLPALESLMENFSHEVAAFAGLPFPHVTFATSHSRVHTTNLRAERASIETLNGGISGSMNVTKMLELKTTNGAIDVEAVVYDGDFNSDNGNIRGRVSASHRLQVASMNGPIDLHVDLINEKGLIPTRASLVSVNNHIDAKFSLVTLDKEGVPTDGGAFEINGETTNGRLFMEVLDQPHLANLTMDGRSLNDGATIRLSPAFEGSYLLRSVPFSQSLVENNNLHRNNKMRRVEHYKGRHTMHGKAQWHDESEEEMSHGHGSVSISSVRGRNHLML